MRIWHLKHVYFVVDHWSILTGYVMALHFSKTHNMQFDQISFFWIRIRWKGQAFLVFNTSISTPVLNDEQLSHRINSSTVRELFVSSLVRRIKRRQTEDV